MSDAYLHWDLAGLMPPFTLATICPPWVFGPYARAPRHTSHLSESVSLLWDIRTTQQIPAFDFGGYADAREVAAAHVLALEVPAAGGPALPRGAAVPLPDGGRRGARPVPGAAAAAAEGKPGRPGAGGVRRRWVEGREGAGAKLCGKGQAGESSLERIAAEEFPWD
ncbi:hypothetical protein SLS62_000544 [Diatrype stigma]|uniref:Uncharacterized protein n=1 Tax=Diatrype stigma TaxID=117547 RepID=A0AAN9VAF3_9PEZI